MPDKCKLCGSSPRRTTTRGVYNAGIKTHGKPNAEGLCRVCALGKKESEAQKAKEGRKAKK